VKWKAIYGVAFLVGIGCATIVLMIANHQPALPAHPVTKVEVKQPPKEVAPQKEIVPASVEVAVTPEPAKPIEPTKPAPPTPRIQKPPQLDVTALDPAAKEQVGRYALNFVGADPTANRVWATLINDPSLPEKVREDLIEDLNENGFSGGDGRVPTVDDLPLIESRIMLLMEHAPYAMDPVNRKSFAEAYKDLVNMWVELTSR